VSAAAVAPDVAALPHPACAGVLREAVNEVLDLLGARTPRTPEETP